jgi:hypothetical protein
MHPYASLAGQIIGAAIAMFLFSWLIEWALFKRILDDPVQGKVGSVVAAWLIASLVHLANDPGYPETFVIYGIPAIAIGIWKYRVGKKARDNFDELEDTFR